MSELISEKFRDDIRRYVSDKEKRIQELNNLKKFLLNNNEEEEVKIKIDEILSTTNASLNKPGRIKTNLKDCDIIMPVYHGDSRGYFTEIFRKDIFAEYEFPNVSQENISLSSKGVLRGLHFQVGDYCQAKIVMALTGSAIDVVVDMRKGSPTYGQSTAVYLAPYNENDKSTGAQLYVPRGFAHGFVSLEDNTLFNYRVDRPYNYNAEGGIYYNDKELKINWKGIQERYNIDEFLLSDKDEPKTKEQKEKRKYLKDTTNYFIYEDGNIDNMKTDIEGVNKDYKDMVRRRNR